MFWSVVQKAVEQAGADLGIDVTYFGANNDAEAQSQAIEAAIADRPRRHRHLARRPRGRRPPRRRPSSTPASRCTRSTPASTTTRSSARITHVGQNETVAGQGAGERFNELGVTKILCGRQEQTNVALEERCEGLAETFEGEVISEFVGLDADPDRAGEPDRGPAAGRPRHRRASWAPARTCRCGPSPPRETAGRELVIGGFDISPDLIAAIEAGDVAFTVDQQQYLQGYLPVVLMYLQATNLNTAGGGLPILTGPGFVDAENVAEVKALVDAGTR